MYELLNYWTDNEHRDHKQATNKKPYTNNRYSFHDKQVEIACESMESFIARRTEAKILLASFTEHLRRLPCDRTAC